MALLRPFFNDSDDLIRVFPRLISCVPLLESNGEHLVAFDTQQNAFIDYYYGDSQCYLIGSSYQQLLSSLFIDLGYAGLMDLVNEVAAAFRYQHLDSLTQFMESDNDLSAEAAKQVFIDSILN